MYMIVKRRTERAIERIYNEFYGNGYMTKERAEEQKEKLTWMLWVLKLLNICHR